MSEKDKIQEVVGRSWEHLVSVRIRASQGISGSKEEATLNRDMPTLDELELS